MGTKRTRVEEAADAAYYESHRDDPVDWGDAVETPPHEAPLGLGTAVTVRFSEDEAALLRSLAKRSGRSSSEIIRSALRAYSGSAGDTDPVSAVAS